jgi:hypothetical protein
MENPNTELTRGGRTSAKSSVARQIANANGHPCSRRGGAVSSGRGAGALGFARMTSEKGRSEKSCLGCSGTGWNRAGDGQPERGGRRRQVVRRWRDGRRLDRPRIGARPRVRVQPPRPVLFFVSSRPKWRDPGSYLARSFTGEEAGGTRLGFRTSLGRGDPCTQYSENRHRRGMRDFVPVRTGYGEIYLARSFTGEEAGPSATGR